MIKINKQQLNSNAGNIRLDIQNKRLCLWVKPAGSNTEWHSPLLDVEVIDRMQERVDRNIKMNILSLECEEQGIHAVLGNAFYSITIGVWINWVDDELSILIAPAEIEEANDALYRIHSIMVLPELMQAKADEKMLLPISTGVLSSPAGKPKLADRFLIYGEQERWELMPILPVCAINTTRGNVMCLTRQGACDAWFAVSTDGKGNGKVAMGAMFRQHWIDPVDWQHREFRYKFMNIQDSFILAIAKRIRLHIIDDFSKKTLKQRAEESPQCAYQQNAYSMKMFHGIQQQGIMMYDTEKKSTDLFYKRVMTFKQAEDNLKKLKNAGIDRVYLQSVGWNPRGHDGAWPTDFPIDHRLGGEKGFRELIETAKNIGYHITTHLNMGMSCFNSPDYTPDYLIQDIWNAPKVTGFWGGGVHGTHWGLALPDTRVDGRMEALKKLGFNGMQYLDFQGNPLYKNYHPAYGGPRADFAAGILRYQVSATRIFGAVQIEAGFLYCATHTDAVCAPYYNPFHHWPLSNTDWPVMHLADRYVPLYQLAVHDLLTQEQSGITWQCAMNAILFGRVMRDEWSAEPGIMPVLTDERIAAIKAIYDLVTVKFCHLVTQQITHWESPCEMIEKTIYEDGTEVLADFTAKRLWVNGQEIPCPPALIN